MPCLSHSCLALLFSLCTVYGLASEIRPHDPNENDTQQLDPIVVSATLTPHPLAFIPASISIIQSDILQIKQATSLGAALSTIPGFNSGGGARPNAEIPSIRGYSGKQILLLVDGARNNDGSGFNAPLMINPTFLAQADVVRGATSALYGSGGLGGAIVLRTISAIDLLHPEKTSGADISTGFSSADISHNTNFRVYAKQAQVDGLLALGYRDWNRIRLGGGDLLRPNHGHANSGLIKLGWQPSSPLRLELSHLFYDEQNLRPNNPQANSLFPYIQNNHIAQQQTTLSANLTDNQGDPLMNMRIYQSELKRSADPTLTPPQNANASVTKTTGFSIQRSHRLHTHYFTYGVDYYQDQQSANDGSKPNSAIPNGRQTGYGLFLQDEIAFTQNWQFIPTVRSDHVVADNTSGQPSSNQHVSPKITLAWQAQPWLNLYTSYGESFRAASISETYQSLSGTTYFSNFSPNINLHPEIAQTIEIGANFRTKQLFNDSDQLRSRVAIFQSNARNLITSCIIGSYRHPVLGPRPIIQYQNIGHARRYGIELENTYTDGALELGLNFSHIRVFDRDTGMKLFAPPDKLSLQAAYHFIGSELSGIWNTTTVAAQNYDATLLRRRSGYAVHNAYLSWAFWKQPWRLDMGIENIFDKRYSSYQAANIFSYVNEIGRTFKVTLSANL